MSFPSSWKQYFIILESLFILLFNCLFLYSFFKRLPCIHTYCTVLALFPVLQGVCSRLCHTQWFESSSPPPLPSPPLLPSPTGDHWSVLCVLHYVLYFIKVTFLFTILLITETFKQHRVVRGRMLSWFEQLSGVGLREFPQSEL